MVTLVAIDMLMAMVMGCHSPCEPWEFDAIHHANGNGYAIPSASLMLMLMLMVLGMLMTMLMLLSIAMAMLMAMQIVLYCQWPFTHDLWQCYVGP